MRNITINNANTGECNALSLGWIDSFTASNSIVAVFGIWNWGLHPVANGFGMYINNEAIQDGHFKASLVSPFA